MAANCCESLAKCIIILFNIVFCITGLLLICVGGYVQVSAGNYSDFQGEGFPTLNTPIAIIIVGVIIFVIAFFGCCGASKENKCMLYTYSMLLTVILIIEIGVSIAALAMKDLLEPEIQKSMKETMMKYGKLSHEEVTDNWDFLQQNLQCCGVVGPTDWNAIPVNINTSPDSGLVADSGPTNLNTIPNSGPADLNTSPDSEAVADFNTISDSGPAADLNTIPDSGPTADLKAKNPIPDSGPAKLSMTDLNTFPDSCCVVNMVGCGADSQHEKFQDGCLTKIELLLMANIHIVGGVALAFAFIQLLGAIFAFCIARHSFNKTSV